MHSKLFFSRVFFLSKMGFERVRVPSEAHALFALLSVSSLVVGDCSQCSIANDDAHL